MIQSKSQNLEVNASLLAKESKDEVNSEGKPHI